MKKLIYCCTILLAAVATQANAKQINVCSMSGSTSGIGYELTCDIGGKTNLKKLYSQGWRLIIIDNTHWVSYKDEKFVTEKQYFLEK